MAGGGLIKNDQQRQVSLQRRLPVDNVGSDTIQTISSETVQLYYYNSGVLTTDAGQVAGVVVVGKLANRNIKNALGDVTGQVNDTSLTFTSTTLTSEVAFPFLVAENYESKGTGTAKASAITSGFSNGQYCVDYRTGTAYGVKADTGTTLTVTYKIETSISSTPISVGNYIQGVTAKDAAATEYPVLNGYEYEALGALTTDGSAAGDKVPAKGTATGIGYITLTNGTQEMPTMDAAARRGYFQLTDGTSSLTLGAGTTKNVPVGLNDGTTAIVFGTDTVKTVPVKISDGTNSPAILARTTGAESPADTDDALVVYDVGGGGASSAITPTHVSPIDFSVAYTSNVTITCSGAPFTIDDANCFIPIIYYKPTGSTWQTPIVNGSGGVSIIASSNVITVAGAGTPFASGDEYVVAVKYQDKGFVAATEANRSSVINPANSFRSSDVVTYTNITTNTTTYDYFDIEGMRTIGLGVDTSGTTPTDTLTITLEVSFQNDGTAAASCRYYDYTLDFTGASSWVDTDFSVIIDLPVTAKYLRIKKVTSNGGGNDADVTYDFMEIY